MNEWKKCDGCGAKYRGNACPYCMTLEDGYEESAGIAEDIYFVADPSEGPQPFLYGDCWPKREPREVTFIRPGREAKEFELAALSKKPDWLDAVLVGCAASILCILFLFG